MHTVDFEVVDCRPEWAANNSGLIYEREETIYVVPAIEWNAQTISNLQQ